MMDDSVYQQIINLLSDAVIISDKNGKVVFVNNTYSVLTTWTLDEIKDCNYRLIYDVPESGILAKTAFLFGKLYCKNGEKLSLNATCCPLYDSQDKTTIIGQIATFHSELNTQKQKNSDDFVSTVSHELRTPLTSIKGFAETLIISGDKIQEFDKKRFLKIIKDQADHLTHLVEDLLFVSKLDNYSIHLVMRELDLRQQIDKICETMSHQLINRTFLYEIESDLPYVIADSDRLEQVLRNLISNSIKYSPDHSFIKIRVARYFKEENSIKISIIDHGFGIPPKNQENIFKRFGRIDNPLIRKIKGTGLGLYISKSLVQAMNGNIWLEKSDGLETIFSFTLKTKERRARDQRIL